MSAADAKKTAKRASVRPGPAAVYTVAGKSCTLAQVVALVHKFDPTAVVTEKRIKARLDRGHRDIKVLAADKLPNYRPTGLRGKFR